MDDILVGPVDVFDRQDSQASVIPLVMQGNSHAFLDTNVLDRLFREVKGDGHAEENAIGQAVLLDDTGE